MEVTLDQVFRVGSNAIVAAAWPTLTTRPSGIRNMRGYSPTLWSAVGGSRRNVPVPGLNSSTPIDGSPFLA
jgi:hypothetical protein